MHLESTGAANLATWEKAKLGSVTAVLEHVYGECTGNWRLIGTGETRLIRCDRCDAQFAASPENRLAAIDENYAGIYLRRLTSEGASQIDSDRDAA